MDEKDDDGWISSIHDDVSMVMLAMMMVVMLGMSSLTSLPFLLMSSKRNNLELVWISPLNVFYIVEAIWEMLSWLPLFSNVITSLMDDILQLLIWQTRIKSFLHFVFMFVVDFNRWRQFKNFSWDGGHKVGF